MLTTLLILSGEGALEWHFSQPYPHTRLACVMKDEVVHKMQREREGKRNFASYGVATADSHPLPFSLVDFLGGCSPSSFSGPPSFFSSATPGIARGLARW